MFSSMELESQVSSQELNEHKKMNRFLTLKTCFLLLNCFMLAVGNSGGPLVMRLYYNHGGEKVWLSSWLETGGWPFMIIPLLVSYLQRRKKSNGEAKLILMSPFIFGASAFLGLLTGVDDFLYSQGVSRLPVSTSSLIISTQLAFTAGFGFLLVKQRFNSYTINAIFMLTIGAVVLALHTSGDRPNGESNKEYFVGFFMTLGASALYGFVLPMVELTYQKSKLNITYALVMEMQLVMCFSATVFCTIGMLCTKGFQDIPREAREFGLGPGKYYMVLVFNAVAWQFFFLGAIGVIFYASSLLSGILIAVFLPLTEVLAVIFYHEKFTAEKAIALTLSLWGFLSYFYGEFKTARTNGQTTKSQNTVSASTQA